MPAGWFLLALAVATPAFALNITSAATGNWSATGTWSSGTVPTAADNVTIANGHTVTLDVTAASCLSLTVGQGVSGTLIYTAATARTLTVGGDVTIAVGGTLQSAATGTVTTHVLSVAGNLTNNGTLDLSTNANTAGAGLTFTGAASNTFGGTGATTDLRSLTINKGTSSANVLEITASTFTVRGTTTAGAFLTLTNGTLKLSGTFAGNQGPFAAAAYVIPATGGFWLNNPNFTVTGQNGSPTNNGLLRITQGAYNVGTAADAAMGAGAGATFTIEGGSLTFVGRLISSNAVNYTQTGGTVTVATLANTTNNAGAFDLTSTSTSFNMSGGTIVLQQASTSNAGKRDYVVSAAAPNITGGTLQVGNTATAAASNFQIAGAMPALVVDNTTNTKTATIFLASPASSAFGVTINTGSTLNLSGNTLTCGGAAFTNNGTLTGTTAGSTLQFLSASLAQSYAGSGTVTNPLEGLTVDSPSGLTLSSTANVPVLNARLFRGTLTNANKLTLGGGAAAAVQTLIGKAGLATAGGTFDVAPTFNLGTGSYSVSYQQEGFPRTTGLELPAGRSLNNVTVNNTNGVTLAGGNLTVTGALTLTNGTLATGASTLAMGPVGTVARTNGFVVGNLRKNVATGTAVSRTFEVGTGTSYTPATLVFASVGTAGDVTATSVAGDHPNLATSGINSIRSVNRYWSLTNSGAVFTTFDITPSFVASDLDAGANTATFVVRRYNAPNWTALTTGTRTATSTQATGVTAFGEFAVGENSHVITASAGANGSIAPSGTVVVADGGSQAFTFTPNACYRVADVLVDGVSVGAPASYTFTGVTADHTIAVSFVNTFAITATAGVHGAISPSGTTLVACGTDQTYTITPDPDYLVADVLVDGVSVGAVTSYTFTNVTTAHTIAASFFIANNPPVIANVPAAATIPELAPYTFTATATDVEAPPEVLTFSLLAAPAGAAIDSLSGVFTWTPSEEQGPGSYPFTVRVSDGQYSADAAITLTVTEADQLPVLADVPASATIPEMVAYTFTASATDPDLPPQTLTFSLVSAPAGAAIDGSTGVFSWTPSETQGPGSYPFTVRVTDGLASTDSTITLDVTEVNVAPVVSGVPASVSVPELVPYTFTASATDTDVPAQSLTFSLVGEPAGAAIDPGTGVFTWTPTSAQTGSHAFSVRASDGVVNTDAPINVTVTVTAIPDLSATQITSGNDASGTTAIQLGWTPLAGAPVVEVYRAGFGGYPRYDDAGGQEPAVPSYPPGPPWVLTTVTAPGMSDHPATRDFYYYVAFVLGAGSQVSPVSNRTPGTLAYHLGDVSDGITAGQGENLVTMADLSLLGAHYGIEGAEAALYDYLDVGPTTDFSTTALPLTDGIIDFEDLIVMAINVDAVSRPASAPRLARDPAGGRGVISLAASFAPAVGDTFDCPIRLEDAQGLRGLSVRFRWNPARVRPLSMLPGTVVAAGQGLVLSPRPGTVDAAALTPEGLTGPGLLATLRFVAIAPGDPGVSIERVTARDARNRPAEVTVAAVPVPPVRPEVTAIAPASPNPFRERTAWTFDLARPGRVELTLFSVDGRRVRTLVSGARDAGRYEIAWDGRDARGQRAAPGIYFARFEAGRVRLTRRVVLLP